MVVAKSKLAELKTEIQGYGKSLEKRGLVRMTYLNEKTQGFTVIHREWAIDFRPADDSIFRRV